MYAKPRVDEVNLNIGERASAHEGTLELATVLDTGDFVRAKGQNH